MNKKLGGSRDGLSLSYDNLFPIEAKAAAQAAFVYGAEKYSRKATNQWEKIFNTLDSDGIISIGYDLKRVVVLTKALYEITVSYGGDGFEQKYDGRVQGDVTSAWAKFEELIYKNLCSEDISSLVMTLTDLQGKFIDVEFEVTPEDSFSENLINEMVKRGHLDSRASLKDVVGSRNWERGLPWQSLIESLKRHIDDFERGKDYDDGEGGSGLPQVSHIMASAAMLCASVVRGIGLDNRVKEDEQTRALYAKDCSLWVKKALEDAEAYRSQVNNEKGK